MKKKKRQAKTSSDCNIYDNYTSCFDRWRQLSCKKYEANFPGHVSASIFIYSHLSVIHKYFLDNPQYRLLLS